MRALSINDCGTAHEDKLLEIYNDVMSIEKKKTGKELTSLEKTKIEMQVAEAYQTILNNCKDGGSISQALNLLGKRITTIQISVNEIPKVAVDIVNEVHSTNLQNRENNGGNQVLEAVGAAHLANNMYEKLNKPEPITLPNVWENLDTPEISGKYDQTSILAEAGDKNAQCTKGLINYSLDYLRTVDNDKPKGKQAMVLTLIKNLSDTGDLASLEIAKKLSEQYKFDVFSVDENGKLVLDKEKHFDMYKERMLQINPKAAESIPNLLETKRDYLIERSKESPKTYQENLKKIEEEKKLTVFAKKYNQYIKAGEFDKSEEFVRQNQDIAKDFLNENVRKFGIAQMSGNKRLMTHLQKINSNLSSSVAKISKEKAIDATKVGVKDVVSSVNPDTKTLIPDGKTNKKPNVRSDDREL